MKRVKATVWDLVEIVKGGYLAYHRQKNIITGERGYRYILNKKLSDSEKEELMKFKNVTCGECGYVYAPEIRHDTVTLWDKCIR